LMGVATARAKAQEAEQQALTVEAEGKAMVMTAKYEIEQEKVRAVVSANQKLEVARIERKAAEQEKQRQILLGQGEATRKRLVMQADGALNQKLEAVVTINAAYAKAIAEYKGAWVPSIVMGGSPGQAAPGSGARNFIDLLMMRAARDLGVDLGVEGRQRTKAKD